MQAAQKAGLGGGTLYPSLATPQAKPAPQELTSVFERAAPKAISAPAPAPTMVFIEYAAFLRIKLMIDKGEISSEARTQNFEQVLAEVKNTYLTDPHKDEIFAELNKLSKKKEHFACLLPNIKNFNYPLPRRHALAEKLFEELGEGFIPFLSYFELGTELKPFLLSRKAAHLVSDVLAKHFKELGMAQEDKWEIAERLLQCERILSVLANICYYSPTKTKLLTWVADNVGQHYLSSEKNLSLVFPALVRAGRAMEKADPEHLGVTGEIMRILAAARPSFAVYHIGDESFSLEERLQMAMGVVGSHYPEALDKHLQRFYLDAPSLDRLDEEMRKHGRALTHETARLTPGRKRALAKKTVECKIPCQGIKLLALPKQERLEFALQGAVRSADIHQSISELELDEHERAEVAQMAARTNGVTTTQNAGAYKLEKPEYRFLAARNALIQNRKEVFPLLHHWNLSVEDYERLRPFMSPSKKYEDPIVVTEGELITEIIA